MKELLSSLLKAPFYLIVFITGTAMVAIGFLDFGQKDVFVQLREPYHLPLVVFGGFLIVSSILFAYRTIIEKIPRAPREPKSNFDIKDKIVDFGYSSEIAGSFAKKFLQLSATQKHIVFLMYEYMKPIKIPIEQLYNIYCARYGGKSVTSVMELHYRLKDLANQGFLVLESKGVKSTIVESLPEVDKILRDHDLLLSI